MHAYPGSILILILNRYSHTSGKKFGGRHFDKKFKRADMPTLKIHHLIMCGDTYLDTFCMHVCAPMLHPTLAEIYVFYRSR